MTNQRIIQIREGLIEKQNSMNDLCGIVHKKRINKLKVIALSILVHGDADHGYFLPSADCIQLIASAIAEIRKIPIFSVIKSDMVAEYCRDADEMDVKAKMPRENAIIKYAENYVA